MYFLSNLSLLLWTVVSIFEAWSIDCNEDLGEVIFVNVFHRHGARTPGLTYKNDPYKNAFSEGLGELTNEGKTQTYELGKWLRHRYNSLLTDTYSPELIYVMTTDVDRVLMSAECCLAGMYPPVGDQVWDKELNWQPIPVHTIPRKLDKVLAEVAPCPAYDTEFQNVLNSTEGQHLRRDFQELIDILNSYTGENRTDFLWIYDMYDTLLVQSQHNLELPEWTNDIFPHPLQEATIVMTALSTCTTKLARLKTGLLLKEITNNMKDSLKKKTKRVMNLYVAHDYTIVNLLNTLGVYDWKMPPYAACVMLELRVASSGNHYVSLFYRTSATETPQLLTIPGCDARCPLDHYLNIIEPLLPEDRDKECKETI